MDIASLGIRIDSRDAKTAESELNRMVGAGTRAERALGGVGAGGRAAAAGSRQASLASRDAARSMDAQASSAQRLTAMIRTYAAAAVGAFSVREVVRAADAWQGLENRLRLVTSSHSQLQTALNDVFNIAQRTSQEIDSVGQVYQRFAMNAGALGLSQQKVAELAETTAKAIAVSGSEAAAAEGALMQFGQALAAGVLRGEEFNSVMEGAPGLAQALARGLGVPVGALRSLAAEGAITGDKIVEALTKARDSVDTQFETRIKTVGQAMVELGNSVTRYIGEMSGAAGASSSLADGISSVADAIDRARGSLEGVKREVDGFRTLTELIQEAWEAADEFGKGFQRMLGTSDDRVRSLADNFVTSFTDSFLATAKEVDAFGRVVFGHINGMMALFKALGENVVIAFENAFNRVRERLSELMAGMAQVMNDTFGTSFDTSIWVGPGDESFRNLVDAYREGTEVWKDGFGAYDALARRVGDNGIWRAAEAAMAAYTDQTDGANDALGGMPPALDNTKKKLTEAAKAQQAFERERQQALQAQYAAISAIHEEARGIEDQVALYGLSRTAIEDLTIARLEEQAALLSGRAGAEEQLEIFEREIEARKRLRAAIGSLENREAEKAAWESWSRDVEQIFQQVGQSLTDAIFEGGKSARDLVKDLFKTLTLRVLIQPVMGGLQGMFMGAGPAGIANAGSAAGGMMGSPTSLFSMFGGNSMGMGMSNVMSSLSTSSMLQGTGVGNWLMGQAGNVAGMSNLALGGAGLLGGLGANLIFGGKGHSGIGGGLGSTVGMALGGPLGAVAGSLIGGGLGSLFGDREPTTRREQRTQVEYAGGLFDVTKVDDRAPAGADAAARALAEQAVSTANDIFRQVGVDAAIDSFHAIMASSYRGDRDGVASGGRLRIGDEYRQFGIANEGNPTIQGFGGWSDAPTLPRLATDIQLSILQAFQEADVLSSILDGIDIRGLSDAAAAELSATIQAIVQEVGVFQQAVESLPFANLRDLSFDAAAGLIAAAGGLENLNAGMTSYYQNFYSEAEQLEWATQQMGTAFAGLGMNMPDVTQGADAAKAAYRGLVESLDLSSEWGQQAYATLMTLSGGFAELVTGMDEMNGVVTQTARSAGDIAKERYNLETQLLQIMGDTDALRARELVAINESNRALQEHIWAMNDQAAAAQAASAAFQSAASQLQRSMQMVTTGGALADKLGGMLGYAPVFGPMREQQLWDAIGSASYEQQIEMAGELTDMVLNRINAEQQANQQRLATIREELTNYRRMRDIGASLQTYLGSLESSNLAPYSLAEKVSNAESELASLVAAARRGDENALRQVQGALQNALTLWRDYGASGQEYQDAYHRLTGMVGNLANAAVSDAARQIAQLEAQSAALESMSGISAESLAQLQQLYDITTAATKAAQEQYQSDLANANTELAQLEKMGLDTARLHEIADLLKGMPALIGAQLAGASAARGGIDWMGAGAQLSTAERDARYYAAKLDLMQRTGDTEGGYDWSRATVDDLRKYAEMIGITPEEHYRLRGKAEGLSYAVGTNYVPYDMTANVHRGEIIIDPRSSDVLRRYGIGVQGKMASDGEVVAELRAIRTRLERIEAQDRRLSSDQIAAINSNADHVTKGVGDSIERRNRDDVNERNSKRRGLAYDRR